MVPSDKHAQKGVGPARKSVGYAQKDVGPALIENNIKYIRNLLFGKEPKDTQGLTSGNGLKYIQRNPVGNNLEDIRRRLTEHKREHIKKMVKIMFPANPDHAVHCVECFGDLLPIRNPERLYRIYLILFEVITQFAIGFKSVQDKEHVWSGMVDLRNLGQNSETVTTYLITAICSIVHERVFHGVLPFFPAGNIFGLSEKGIAGFRKFIRIVSVAKDPWVVLETLERTFLPRETTAAVTSAEVTTASVSGDTTPR